MRRSLAALGLAATAVVSGCATLGMATNFHEPIVNFRDARVTGLGLNGGAVEVVLSVYNPNHFKLEGTRLTYNLMVDSTSLGSGAYDQRFTVQDRDSSIVTLPLTFTYKGVGAASRQLMQTGQVKYRVLGDITVATPLGNFTRPYDRTGRFSTLTGSSR